MDPVADLLAQFPGPVSLAFSRWKLLFYLAGSACLGAFSIHWIVTPDSDHAVMGWFGSFFILGIPVFAIAMIPGASEMVLDQDGFTLRLGYRSTSWTWTEVGDFAVIKDYLVPFKKNVAFNDRRRPRSRKLSESGELPSWRDVVLDDSYGLSKDDCVRLLSEWQQRAFKNMRHSAGISSGGSQLMV